MDDSHNNDPNQPPCLPNWDFIPAQKLVMSILSSILYARSAFPADCFKSVTEQDITGLDTTHESLIKGGVALSSSSSARDSILSTHGPLLYFRKSAYNFRLHGFLNDLNGDGRTLAAIRQQRLAKIQICFSSSKTWNKSGDSEALIEFYTLKFCYTPGGSLYVYIDWGGSPEHSVPVDCGNPFNEFLRTQAPIAVTNYVHYYIYGTDRKPLNQYLEPGLGSSIRQAVSALSDRPASSSGRIDVLGCHSRSEADAQQNLEQPSQANMKVAKHPHQLEKHSLSQETNDRALVSKRKDFDSIAPVPQAFEETSWAEDLHSPRPYSKDHSHLMGEDGARSRFGLAPIIEISDDLQATQLLSTQGSSQRRTSFVDDEDDEDDQDEQPQGLNRKRTVHSSPDHFYFSDRPRQIQSKRRSTGRFSSSVSTDALSRLDASQPGPSSRTMSPTEPNSEAAHVSAISWQPRIPPPAPAVTLRRSQRQASRVAAGGYRQK